MMIWEADDGQVGLLDDSGESLGMAMLAWDITRDINTSEPGVHRRRPRTS